MVSRNSAPERDARFSRRSDSWRAVLALFPDLKHLPASYPVVPNHRAQVFVGWLIFVLVWYVCQTWLNWR